MNKFTTVRSIAAPLPESDVDTDVIFPARFLLLLDKAGLGEHLFHGRRQARSGGQKPDFVLDRPAYARARILVAGANFGCGSSREQAVWALADFGIACVIAPSFGEIFFANCFKNGVLPIRLEPEAHARVMTLAQDGALLTVDLEHRRLAWDGGAQDFAVDPYRRLALLSGLDEIDLIIEEDHDAILAFEARHGQAAPWLEIGPLLAEEQWSKP